MPTATSSKAPASPPLPEAVSKAVADWLYNNAMVPAKAYRTDVIGDDEWPTYRQLYDGDHYNKGLIDPPEDYPGTTVNIVMPTIDTVKSIALQSPARAQFSAIEPDDYEFAESLTSVIGTYLWGVRKARYKLGIWWNEGSIIGTGWVKPYWDERILGGDGDVDFYVLPSDEVWLDPSATSVYDAAFIIHAPRRTVRDIRYDVTLNDYRLLVRSDSAETEGVKEDSEEQYVELATAYEYWVRGWMLEALAEEVPEFKAKVTDLSRKYGMVFTVAGGYTLKYVDHPWKSDRLPFARFVYYAGHGNRQGYGRGEPFFLKDIALSIDARVTQILHHAALISNEQVVIYNSAVVDESEVNAKPGQKVHVDGPPGSFDKKAPGGISGALFSTVDLLVRLAEIVSGMFDVNKGQEVGRLAGVAIQALQRGGEGRTAQKVANFDDAVADLAMCIADIMAVKYNTERVFRIIGASVEAAPAIDPVTGGPMTDPETGEPLAQPVVVPAKTVTLSKSDFWKAGREGERRVELDCRAMVGRILRSLEEKFQSDVEGMQAGVFDAQYVIENNKDYIENSEGLLRRLVAMQQAQAMMQGAGAAGPEAPMPEGEPAPAEAEPMLDPAQAAQAQQVIDQMLQQMQALEDEGTIPPGSTAQIATMVQQEQSQGGSGEQALAEAQRLIEQWVAEGAGQQPGVAPTM
jgi:hypothetical protein